MKPHFIIALLFPAGVAAQQPYSASFVAKLGSDTVIVETYNMFYNHLYGKAFLRYPQDQIGIFDFHFNSNGSIRHYTISFMNPDSAFITSAGSQGIFCENNSCTWYGVWPGCEKEYEHKYNVDHIDFIGGWTPVLSLIEWNCMRLIKSGQQSLPLTLINDYIGLREVGITKGNKDTLIFGGPFLKYTKITATPEGRILTYDGTSTPWSYIVTKHAPIDVDEVAKRMTKTPKIGIPSPTIRIEFPFDQDTIKLSYGSPAKRDRLIFGGVVPFDSVWRTGANEATRIVLPFDTRFEKTLIPKGEYSLYTIPTPTEWTLIFNTDLKEWPTDRNRSKDFVQVKMKLRKPARQQERLAINIEKQKYGGTFTITWDETEAFIPFAILKK